MGFFLCLYACTCVHVVNLGRVCTWIGTDEDAGASERDPGRGWETWTLGARRCQSGGKEGKGALGSGWDVGEVGFGLGIDLGGCWMRGGGGVGCWDGVDLWEVVRW